MLSRALRRVRGTGPDAGLSLAELLVSMSLLSIAGALALTMLVNTTETTDRTTNAGLTTAGARNTMSAWTDLLQVAVLPDADATVRDLTITPTSLAFNAQLANLPTCTDRCIASAATKVTLQLRTATIDGTQRTQLVQTLTRPSGADTVVQVFSGAALVPAASGQPQCLFRPYRADGTALDCTSLANTATLAVARVDIAFRVTPPGGGEQTFTSSAKLPGSFA